jgi:hypothetical protein
MMRLLCVVLNRLVAANEFVFTADIRIDVLILVL